MKTAKQMLVEARALIEDPENWITGLYTLERDGRTCHCAEGAFYAVDREDRWDEFGRAEGALHDALPDGFKTVPHFNDNENTTHADVLALFDRAIASVSDD